MQIRLPYPPTINHYYGRNRGRTYITKRGQQFRQDVAYLVAGKRQFGPDPVAIHIDAYPPARRGDIDNLIKPTLDALNTRRCLRMIARSGH